MSYSFQIWLLSKSMNFLISTRIIELEKVQIFWKHYGIAWIQFKKILVDSNIGGIRKIRFEGLLAQIPKQSYSTQLKVKW